MYVNEWEDNKMNREVMTSLVKGLRVSYAGLAGLKTKVRQSCYPLLADTTLLERRTFLEYSLRGLDDSNTVILTGQCLVKRDEDPECPVTLEDALECEKLRDILSHHPVPAVCIYPDSTYRKFIRQRDGDSADDSVIGRATERYMAFRRHMLPEVQHVRISEVDLALPRDVSHLGSRIRRVYNGKLLSEGGRHPLQEVILEYGVHTFHVPSLAGHGDKNIAVFAEPDEICSVKAAELVRDESSSPIQIGLIGQLPLPGLGFLAGGDTRMYSAPRRERVHLNEGDTEIHKKLYEDHCFTLLALQLSPLTSKEQLEEIGKSRDRKIGTDLLMEQVRTFRSYLR